MKHPYLTSTLTTVAVLTLGLLAPGLSQAQEAPALATEVQALNAPAAEVAPTSGEEWWEFSRNNRLVYLVDVKGGTTADGANRVRVARVPIEGAPDDATHKADDFEIRCGRNESRMLAEIEFDAEGNEVERYPEDGAEWETIRATSLSAYFKPIICEGARPDGPAAASIKAFVARGRN